MEAARILAGGFLPDADSLEHSLYQFCPRPGFQKRFAQFAKTICQIFNSSARLRRIARHTDSKSSFVHLLFPR